MQSEVSPGCRLTEPAAVGWLLAPSHVSPECTQRGLLLLGGGGGPVTAEWLSVPILPGHFCGVPRFSGFRRGGLGDCN